jgi:acetate kinase
MSTAAPTSLPDRTLSGVVAVINAGSSSVKFALHEATPDAELLFRGQIEGIGVHPHLKVRDAKDQAVAERSWGAKELDHAAATREILTTARNLISGTPVLGVGHRVVHGGVKYTAPVRVDREVLAELEKLVPLAPLHQPHNLAPIGVLFEAAPQLPQVACFDTAFHRSQSHLAQAFAIPRSFSNAGVRRYGFHGLSYEYLVSRLREVDPEVAEKRIVFAHLGNGSSLCAAHQGRSVASTMGFTAVDGLMMGTRCGAIDAGVILYLLQEHHMDAAGVEDFIYRQSGLLGVSGISSDMRTLRASTESAAREAIDLFVYRIVREIGSLAAALGGVDGLVFSAGIGENDPATRAEAVAGCAWIGAALDAERNARGELRISSSQSRIPVFVIPTDEERMIARHTMRILRQPAASVSA